MVDYALARRPALTALAVGRTSVHDACDAHPYLVRAARHHGEATTASCPVCRGEKPLTHVTYTYGDELGEASGRVRATRELAALAEHYSALTVYVVEVCQACGWNHLTTSFVIGTGEPVPRRGARRQVRRELADR